MAGELNVTGLVNNFDMNSLLQQIQAIKSQQILMLQNQQSKIASKKTAVSDIQTILKNIQQSITDLSDQNTINSKSLNISNPNILSATITDPTKIQEGIFNIDVNQLAKNQIYASNNTVSDKNTPLGLTAGTLTIHMNGLDYNIGYDNTYSLQNIADKINETANTYNGNFRASVINVGTSSNPSYKLVISGTKTGEDNGFTISDSGNLVSSLNINSIQSAQNAQVTVNGLTLQNDTNTFNNIEGLSFTVNQIGSTNITISKDSKPLKDALNSLISNYNNLVDTLNKETGKDGKLSGEYSLNIISSGIFRQMDELFRNGLINFDRTTGHISINNQKFDDMYNNNLSELQTILQNTKNDINEFLQPYTQYSGILDQKIKSYDSQINNIQKTIDLQSKRIQMEMDTLKNQFVWMQMLQAQYNDISARLQSTFGLQTK